MGYVYVALTVLLTVIGQFLIKWQVGLAGPLPLESRGKLLFLAHLMLKPWILTGLCAAFVASMFWMLAMTKLPLSQAYPFMASSFVLVIFGGAWLFLEPIGLGKILGTFLIIAGVIIIGFDRP